MTELISYSEYLAILQNSALLEQHSPLLDGSFLCVDINGKTLEPVSLPLPPCPVIGVGKPKDSAAKALAVDLSITGDALGQVSERINHRPKACATLVQLLRHNEANDIIQGLFAESLCYSTLQQSAEFRTWLADSELPEHATDHQPSVLIGSEGDTITITLNRPAVHNAYSMAMKDALCEALDAANSGNYRTLVLRANGPSFSAGGDLSEFGQVTDAIDAHLSRTTRSAAMKLATFASHSEAYLQGACIGAGIEIPSFVRRLVADEESFFLLPEIGMGLVPGAGGTVGITRRIGRQRTAYMAISGARIPAPLALKWGLVDELKPR